MKRAWVVLSVVIILTACSAPAPAPDRIVPPVKSYVPMVAMDPIVMGVQMEGDALLGRDRYFSNGAIHLSLRWSDVEKTRGVYTWPVAFDVMAAAVAPRRLILNLKNSPTWARTIPALECSAPFPGYYGDYANFVVAAANRFDPYAVEIWNEPDVQPAGAVDGGHWYGCIGDGITYSRMVTAVDSAMNRNRPDVLVVAGALMLGETMHAFTEAFLSGSLEPFDAVSYHAYVTYPSTNYDYAFGPGKAGYLRTLTQKPLWITETSLLCRSNCTVAFETAQANYFSHVFRNAREEGVDGLLWYSIANNGWLHSELVERDRRKPAWSRYCLILSGCDDAYPAP